MKEDLLIVDQPTLAYSKDDLQRIFNEVQRIKDTGATLEFRTGCNAALSVIRAALDT